MYSALLAACLSVGVLSSYPIGNSIPDVHSPLPKRKQCDQTSGCRAKTFTDLDANARCFGTYGCANAVFETERNNVVCAGAAACWHAYHSGSSQRVLCSGYKACERSQAVEDVKSGANDVTVGMTSQEMVICQGFQACGAIKGGIDAPVIRCDGDLACSNKVAKKNGIAKVNLDLTAEAELFCNGKMACFESVIRAGMVYCDGDGACKKSQIVSDTVACHGKQVCAQTQINSAGDSSKFQLDLFGMVAAAKSTLSMPDRTALVADGNNAKRVEDTAFLINAYGMLAMGKATVRNNGNNLVLNAYGYKATAGANVYCSNAKCKITCKGNGCKGLTIDVSTNADAEFEITPALCDPAADGFVWKGNQADCKPPKVNGIDCPAVRRAAKGYTKYPQPYCTATPPEDHAAEIDALIDADQAELDAYIESMEADFEDFAFLKEVDEQKIEQFMNFEPMEEQELHVEAAHSLQASPVTQTVSTLIISNLVTAISVFFFLLVAAWCYVKCKTNSGDYKGLQQ